MHGGGGGALPALKIVSLVATALLAAAVATGAPYTPTDDSVVLEWLPERGNAALGELKRLRASLAADRRDLEGAVAVARRAIEAARATGDPRYTGQAQAALAPWWAAADPPATVLLLRATIKQNQHAFDAALADLDRLLDARPGDAQALLTRATVLTVIGRYAQARQDCRRLARVANRLAAVTCDAAAASVAGEAEAAYSALTNALATDRGNAVLRAWALTLAGEIAARRSDFRAADAHLRDALALVPGDAYTKAAYADVLIDDGRAREVVPLLADDAGNDALLVRLAIAERTLPERATTFAEHRIELRNRFAAARLRGDSLHLREQARFQLDVERDARAALDLAKRNWALQREPADLRILAASARAADDRTSLRTVTDWLEATKLEDRTVQALMRTAER